MEYNIRLIYNRLHTKRLSILVELEKIETEMKQLIHDNHSNDSSLDDNQYSHEISLANKMNVFHINYLLSLPNDVFQQNFLQYLKLDDR